MCFVATANCVVIRPSTRTVLIQSITPPCESLCLTILTHINYLCIKYYTDLVYNISSLKNVHRGRHILTYQVSVVPVARPVRVTRSRVIGDHTKVLCKLPCDTLSLLYLALPIVALMSHVGLVARL